MGAAPKPSSENDRTAPDGALNCLLFMFALAWLPKALDRRRFPVGFLPEPQVRYSPHQDAAPLLQLPSRHCVPRALQKFFHAPATSLHADALRPIDASRVPAQAGRSPLPP